MSGVFHSYSQFTIQVSITNSVASVVKLNDLCKTTRLTTVELSERFGALFSRQAARYMYQNSDKLLMQVVVQKQLMPELMTEAEAALMNLKEPVLVLFSWAQKVLEILTAGGHHISLIPDTEINRPLLTGIDVIGRFHGDSLAGPIEVCWVACDQNDRPISYRSI